MTPKPTGSGFRFTGPVVNLIAVIMGVVAAYFFTIQSLKIELAAKAERAVVETLDKKLGAFEIILKEGVLGKQQFYEFSTEVDARLSRIEWHLAAGSEEYRERR